MESLYENKPLMYSIIGATGSIFALALGLIPDVAQHFEIVEFDPEVSIHLEILFCVNFFHLKNVMMILSIAVSNHIGRSVVCRFLLFLSC